MAANNSCACRGCCIYPNGTMAIVATIFTVGSYLLALFASYGCYYVRVDLTQGPNADLPTMSSFGFGLLSRETVDPDEFYCIGWSEDEADYFFDAAWRTARAFGIMANASGGIAMVGTFCMACMSVPPIGIKVVAFVLVMAGVFEVFTFVAFASDICDTYGCTFSSNAGLSIAATVAFFVTACVVAKIGPYEGEDDDFIPDAVSNQPPPGSVSVSQTVLPDGTKKTIRTTINADGSKTVEETVEAASADVYG